MTDLLQHVQDSIHSHRLFKSGDTLLVAVSGGLDSMVLLRVLNDLSARQRWRIVVAHFNHRLRGRAGDADERLVRRTAAAMKLPVMVESADVRSFAAKSKLSLEMAARKLRHEFLARAARRRRANAIVLAHHADDQVELFFLRLFRGAGGEGLAGMKWRSPSPADRQISVVRPLLDVDKAALREFARGWKITFREDATNSSNDYLRNRIRNQLLPLLRKEFQPGLAKTVLRLMEITGAEAEFVAEAASEYRRRVQAGRSDGAGKNRKGEIHVPAPVAFDRLPVAIQRRVLQIGLVEAGVVTDFDLIEQLRRPPDTLVSVGPGILVVRDSRGAVGLRERRATGFNDAELRLELGGARRAVFGGKRFNWQIVKNQAPFQPAAMRLKREFFDADEIGDRIMLRHWRAGDRFRPIGSKSAAKLQDLFVNAKIPRERRRRLVVAEASGGGIFWVEGLRIGEDFKLRPRTKHRLIWKWSTQ